MAAATVKAYDDPEARHAYGPMEHSLCGLACDAFSSGDVNYLPQYAGVTGTVDCSQCLQMIEHVYSGFTRAGRVK